MKNQLVLIGICALLITIGLSGCNEKSYPPNYNDHMISQHGFDEHNYTMAFILVVRNQADATIERINKINQIKENFSRNFHYATLNLSTMNTSYPVVTLVYDSEIDAHIICQRFYETNPDIFDFISIYIIPEITPNHAAVINRIEGIGNDIYDASRNYGSNGTLLGINVIGDLDNDTIKSHLLHETGHQWGVFIGDAFSGNHSGILEIRNSQGHFYAGLQSPYETGTPMGARHWASNGDGTYRDTVKEDSNRNQRYHPFELYFMGLYTEENYDFNTTFMIYNYSGPDGNFHAIPYKEVSIRDIIQVEGERHINLSSSLPSGYPPTVG